MINFVKNYDFQDSDSTSPISSFAAKVCWRQRKQEAIDQNVSWKNMSPCAKFQLNNIVSFSFGSLTIVYNVMGVVN
jgi:hypothetical protein